MFFFLSCIYLDLLEAADSMQIILIQVVSILDPLGLYLYSLFLISFIMQILPQDVWSQTHMHIGGLSEISVKILRVGQYST